MSFNIFKSKIISFNCVVDTPNYILNGSVLYHVNSTEYLGVTLHSECRFNQHISNKILDARSNWVRLKELSNRPPNERD